MAVPKKKVTRGRRDRRRYGGKKLGEVFSTTQCKQSGELVRTHTISKNAIFMNRDAQK